MFQKHRMIMTFIAVLIALAACLCLAAWGGRTDGSPGNEAGDEEETESFEGYYFEDDDDEDAPEDDEDDGLTPDELGMLNLVQAKDTEEVEIPEGEEDTPVEAPDEEERQDLHDSPESEYFYDQLSPEEQETYDLILAGIRRMETGEIDVTITDMDRVQEIVHLLLSENPDLFWYDNYTLWYYTHGDEVSRVSVQFEYNCDEAERGRRQELIDRETEAILAGAPEGDDYAKIRYVYEQIIMNTDYVTDSPDNQNICSVFLNHESVCHGYALAAQYLLNRMGIDCVSVDGDAGGRHTWSLVWSDGEPYYMDVTWGDPTGDPSGTGDEDAAEGGGDPADNLTYNYLLLTGEEMGRGHHPDPVYLLPDCTAVADNYFVREGLYMESWDPAAFTDIISRNFSNGEYGAAVKFANRAAFDEAYEALLSGDGAWRFVEGLPGRENLSMYWYSPGEEHLEDLEIYAISLEFE